MAEIYWNGVNKVEHGIAIREISIVSKDTVRNGYEVNINGRDMIVSEESVIKITQ